MTQPLLDIMKDYISSMTKINLKQNPYIIVNMICPLYSKSFKFIIYLKNVNGHERGWCVQGWAGKTLQCILK